MSAMSRKPTLAPRGKGWLGLIGGQAFFQVGDQVFGVLEADIEAHDRPCLLAPGRGASPIRVCGDGEAFEPAPAIADPKMPQPVDQLRPLGIASAGKLEREKT